MIRVLLLTVTLTLAGCAPAEPPPPPPAPAKPEVELKRERYFGAAVAADATIEWRSSGLGFKTITPGSGPFAEFSDRVRVHYTGTLADGTVFDDSRARGKPAAFAVSQLVRGMAEGVGLLQPGGRAMLYIPPGLGYGNIRAGNVPPLSGLTFDLELIEIVPPK